MSTRSTIYSSDDGNLHVYTDKYDNGDYCVELHAVNEAVSATVSLSIATVKGLAKWWNELVAANHRVATRSDEVILAEAAREAVDASTNLDVAAVFALLRLGLPDGFDLTNTQAVQEAYMRQGNERRADARKWIEKHAPELVAWEVTK